MSNRDRFELTKTGIYINERSLIDIIKEIEMPYAQIEYDARIEEGEDPKDLYLLAGDYRPLPLHMVKFPSRHLLDNPKDFTFGIHHSNPLKSKTTLLGCTCGIIECWFLLAKITLTETTVNWTDFQNFHREYWEYNLSFAFDRQQY